jgi:hypothetical protein
LLERRHKLLAEFGNMQAPTNNCDRGIDFSIQLRGSPVRNPVEKQDRERPAVPP